jgi:hypothetical protein
MKSESSTFELLESLISQSEPQRTEAEYQIRSANTTATDLAISFVLEKDFDLASILFFSDIIKKLGIVGIVPALISRYKTEEKLGIRIPILMALCYIACEQEDNEQIVVFMKNILLSELNMLIHHNLLMIEIVALVSRTDYIASEEFVELLLPIYRLNVRDMSGSALVELSRVGAPAHHIIPSIIHNLHHTAAVYNSQAWKMAKAISPRYLAQALGTFGTDESIQGLVRGLSIASEAAETTNPESRTIVGILVGVLETTDHPKAKEAITAWRNKS